MKIQMLQVEPYGTNCYILMSDTDSQICAITDPGGSPERIAAAVEAANRVPKAIFLTHGHYDHTGGVDRLRARWQEVPVYLNRRDLYASGVNSYAGELFPFVPDTIDYDEGDTITLSEDLTFQVLSTPGHSEGSVVLLCGDAMLCGDTLFAASCGRTDMPGGDPEKMLSSLRRLSRLEGDYHVYPGHMETTTLERERRINPYMRQAMMELR